MGDAQWTKEEVEARLGISVAVFREPIEERHLAQIREAGITRIELSINRKRVDYQTPATCNAC